MKHPCAPIHAYLCPHMPLCSVAAVARHVLVYLGSNYIASTSASAPASTTTRSAKPLGPGVMPTDAPASAVAAQLDHTMTGVLAVVFEATGRVMPTTSPGQGRYEKPA